MTPIKFEGVTHTLAEDQPQYLPLPIQRLHDEVENVISCWKLTDEDIAQLKITKIIWVSQWTFGNLLQPQRISLKKPKEQLTITDEKERK